MIFRSPNIIIRKLTESYPLRGRRALEASLEPSDLLGARSDGASLRGDSERLGALSVEPASLRGELLLKPSFLGALSEKPLLSRLDEVLLSPRLKLPPPELLSPLGADELLGPKLPPELLPLWSRLPPPSFFEISTLIRRPSSWMLFNTSITFSLCSGSVLKNENPSFTSTL